MKLNKNRDDLYEIAGLLLLLSGDKLRVIPYNKTVHLYLTLTDKWKIET